MSDPVDGQRVLVTGGAGFVGSHLAAALVDRAQVRVLDDQALARAMADVDVVFHQAGMASVEASVGDPVDSHGRNVTGTLSVLEAARRHDARVVLASSAAIYGPPQSTPIAEEHTKRPTTPYGVGTGTETAIVDLAKLVQSIVARPVEIEHVQSRDSDIENSRADITRAREKLGSEPQVSLREGVGALAANRSVEPARS